MKYTPGLMVGRLSRSAGNTTAAHNRNGSYLRNRVIPTNPSTGKQTAVRANLGATSSAWRGLTDAQRAAWGAFGANITRTDTLGESYTLTGQQAFILINRNLFTIGNAAITDAPAYAPPAALLTATVTATSV